MPTIDHVALTKAMVLAQTTPAHLAKPLHITTSYMARICKGERKLKRNPVLRAQIARELGVPVRWIETDDEVAA